MRYLYLLLSIAFFAITSYSQPIFYSNFGDFNIGKLSGQNGWTNNSSSAGGLGSCTGAICTNGQIVNTSMYYSNFDSSINSLSLVSDQDGVGTSFNSVNSGSIYLFILCQFSNVPTTSSDFIRLLGGSNYNTSCRIYLKDASGGFNAGIGKGSLSGTYNSSGPTFLDYNVPHLLVMKYTFKTASSADDVVTLYVDPDMSQGEPTSHEILTAGGTDATLIDRLCFPYNSPNKPTGFIGVVKVSTTWTDGFNIAGKCIFPSGQPVNGATISANGVINTANTDTTGVFNYKLQSGNYTLKATKNNDVNKTNGVTSVDIALTQSHILGKLLLNSPYKIIAADVNGDGSVTALDLVYMKRLILGIDTTFTNTKTNQKRLWTFVDSSYSITSLTSPFVLKDSINIANLSANQTNKTFIGIKLGDVNWDWNSLFPKANPTFKLGRKEPEFKL